MVRATALVVLLGISSRLNSGGIFTRGEDASGFERIVLQRGYLATSVFGNVGVGGAA